jgi:pimeloyl-ACP methyl ester carboxylesterase
MTLYLIGGLGADERVFNFLEINTKTRYIHWIEPLLKEDIKSYALRLTKQINLDEDFGILGVSFGGIIAIEIAKLTNPKVTILISSVESSSQLPNIFLLIGKTGIVNIIPDSLLKPPRPLLAYLFGTNQKELLFQVVNDTKPSFIRWALNAMVSMGNETKTVKTFRIHGTNDKLIPLVGPAIEIKNGSHFMIVDNAKEISKIINDNILSLV